MAEVADTAGDALDTLDTPTEAEVAAVTEDFSSREIANAAAAAALNAGGGGGGSQPVTREQISGTSVTVADNNNGFLTWAFSSGPDSLLDLSVPDAPTAIEAGVYAITVQATPAAGMTVGGFYFLKLIFDEDGEDAEIGTYSPAATASLTPTSAVAGTFYLAEGVKVRAQIQNHDGASHDFTLFAIVQRIA